MSGHSRTSISRCLREGTTPDVVIKWPTLADPWEDILAIKKVHLYADVYNCEFPPSSIAESQEQRYGRIYLTRLLDSAITYFLLALQEVGSDASTGIQPKTAD